MTRIETVSIVYQAPMILLGMKKKKFGTGRYNGFGGGVNDGEGLERCAIRETEEEAGITIINPERIGRILFQFEVNEQNHLVYFFRTTTFNGVLKESDEMKPEWFHKENIPYEQMWPDDKYWLPLLLEGKKFRGDFYFDSQLKIAKHELREVDKID
jgi:8-oxo-dGTP pyrophosphatase MutT (NUDIX family)